MSSQWFTTSQRALLLVCIVCSTFLFQTATASEVGPDPVTNKPKDAPPQVEEGDTNPLMEVNVSEPPPVAPVATDGYFYQYPSALTISAGASASAVSGSFDPSIYSLVNANYLWPSVKNFHFESGFEISIGEDGRFYTVGRYIFSSTDSFRPYWSFGPGVALKPNDKLATFLRLKNYYLRVAWGFESSITQAISFRTEALLGVDFGGNPHVGVLVGFSWGMM